MTRDSAPLTILVISHTHWDREWYHPAARFRQQLVPLVDELLRRPPDEPPFLLDGQSIILTDYLAVRPTARAALATALQDGRLEAGPWYVLADELLPGGEALVRNLLAGRRTLAALGAAAPPVLYSPDAFGHPAALPLIAVEFGLPLIVVWRGFGGPLWPSGDAFRWHAPDDRSVLVHHLPPDGYEFGSNLPSDPVAASARWQQIERTAVSRARLGVVLLLNGADHHAPQHALWCAVDGLAAAADPIPVRRSGMRAAVEELTARAASADLPQVHGELRASFGYTWSLQGTFAVRAHLKQRAVRLERELVRDVEPWLALARTTGGVPPLALEHAAWETLLQCHPHDTLCGCSIDAVARAMAGRLDAGEAEADGLRSDAMHAIVGHDPDAAVGKSDRWVPAVLVRNRAPRARSGVAEIEIATFVRDVPVGPGSAFASPPSAPALMPRLGSGVAHQVLGTEERIERLEPRRRYPDADLVRVRRVAAWLDETPAYGILPLALTEGETPPPRGAATARLAPDGAVAIGNEHLRVSAITGDAVVLETPDGARVVRRALELEDAGDAGDTYTPSLVGPVTRSARVVSAHLVHEGPLRAELQLRYDLAVPESTGRAGRSETIAPHAIEVSCIVDAGAPHVRLRVRGTNAARDHRLRLVLDGGSGPGTVWADAAFGAVRRDRLDVPKELTRLEAPLPTAPLHRYVSVFGRDSGFTLFSNGQTEYEVLDDGRIAVTLFRAVGELSRGDLPERPGHAGWPAETPDAQCLGPFECELAVMLHGPRDEATIDHIERTADDVLLPLVGHTVRQLLTIPAPVQGIALEGDGLAFCTCKRSDDGEWLVLRCVNLLEREVAGTWRLPWVPVAVHRSRLDEAVGEAIAIGGREVPFTAAPRGVVTLLMR